MKLGILVLALAVTAMAVPTAGISAYAIVEAPTASVGDPASPNVEPAISKLGACFLYPFIHPDDRPRCV